MKAQGLVEYALILVLVLAVAIVIIAAFTSVFEAAPPPDVHSPVRDIIQYCGERATSASKVGDMAVSSFSAAEFEQCLRGYEYSVGR